MVEKDKTVLKSFERDFSRKDKHITLFIRVAYYIRLLILWSCAKYRHLKLFIRQG